MSISDYWTLVNSCDGSPASVSSVELVLRLSGSNISDDELDSLYDALAFKSREFYHR